MLKPPTTSTRLECLPEDEPTNGRRRRRGRSNCLFCQGATGKFSGMKPMENYETVFEIFDSIDGRNVLDTEDFDVAQEYFDKGYLVDEHRIQKIKISHNEHVTTIVTINW